MLKIIFEDWYNSFPVDVNEYGQFTIKLGGDDYHFQIQDAVWENGPKNMWKYSQSHYRIVAEQISKLTVKTKEQIAAEESVAKAKEALIAAENALKVVKESIK